MVRENRQGYTCRQASHNNIGIMDILLAILEILGMIIFLILAQFTMPMLFKRINTGIPGLSFSWKRALGVTNAKRTIARKTGIPTTKSGMERKIGNTLIKTIFGK